MYLTVCPLRGPSSIPSRGGEFQEIFPWPITHTWRGDGHRQVITSSLKGYEKYEAIQLLLTSGALPDDEKPTSFGAMKYYQVKTAMGSCMYLCGDVGEVTCCLLFGEVCI